ncbi:hypothetical protein [Phycicoccus duodecadis]|uniref:Uncharacterized protein n=1 Tax=Phycicoccus duodecadis TaxID=173053 RepID=A0A2N3YI89_9MICO|nr:hypothetical protein [Phycicoccus duodecadis]PKW26563.1 hypothetical protein ATL31_1377 [Phycicoccus duodecadis]
METSDEDRLAQRRAHDLAVQEVVDRLAEAGPYDDPEPVAQRLERGLAEIGVVGMPEPWVDAVVRALMDGNAYVVSSFTQEGADVPAPRTRVPDEIID